MSNVVGAVLIITIVEHYFSKSNSYLNYLISTPRFLVIVALVISLGYQYFAAFYRASAREMKRLGQYLFVLLPPAPLTFHGRCNAPLCVIRSLF